MLSGYYQMSYFICRLLVFVFKGGNNSVNTLKGESLCVCVGGGGGGCVPEVSCAGVIGLPDF